MRITTHPGEVLRHEFLDHCGLSCAAFAARLSVPANRISSIVRGDRVVTAETAILFSEALGTTPEFWLNLQQSFDLSKARAEREKAPKAPIRPLA